MGLSLAALYDRIAGDDSDVSGGYPQTVQVLSDAMDGFWRSYDLRQALLGTENIRPVSSEGPSPVEYFRRATDWIPHDAWTRMTVSVRAQQRNNTRRQKAFDQDRAEYHHTMARYRKTAQEDFDTYASRTRDGDSSVAARAYKRDFASLVKSMIPYNDVFTGKEFASYTVGVIVALEDGFGIWNLDQLYDDITRRDSDVRGDYDLSPETLKGAMDEFWRSYDSEQGSARRCTEYHSTMEGYRETAREAFDTYATLHCESLYKQRFAALLKRMVPYLQLKKAEAFAHADNGLCPDVHSLIHAHRVRQ